jgi:SAM-dependent methyltransferase
MLETDLLPWVEAAGKLGDDVLEIGPGPGLTTDLLRTRVARLTAVEIDPGLAGPLEKRLAGTNVDVIAGDATSARLTNDRFSAAMCFSVLHHMPSADDQNRLFSKIQRVLRPGGRFIGVDALESMGVFHEDDTFTPVDPETLPERLAVVGLTGTTVEIGEYQFRFVALKPLEGVHRADLASKTS